MNYAEAVSLIDTNKNLYGKPLYDFDIRYMIISSQEKLAEVMNIFVQNVRSFDNKGALIELGILESEHLDIFLLPPSYVGHGIYTTLGKYLSVK